MSIHNNLYNVASDILPSQIVPLKEKLKVSKDPKEKSWGQKNMDALESIGRTQYNMNLPLIENYEMIKGKFIFSHYFETQGYNSLLAELSKEVELPNYLRHYDIISQVINTMGGEWQKRPDSFKVRQVGDGASNEYLRTKQEMTEQFVMEDIMNGINAKLAEQGVDLEKEDFESEEEQEQYFQELDEMRQSMTPRDIQEFMDTDFLTMAEIWGNDHREKSKEHFNLAEKEKVEWDDMCVADRSFRHFYLSSGPLGYNQETWNPINVFFHKSPDVTYIEEGDYVGRVFNLSINTIIDRYGFKMTKEDFEMLQGKSKDHNKKWEDHKYGWVYDNYLVPFQGYPEYQTLKQADSNLVPPTGGIPQADAGLLANMSSSGIFKEKEGFYFVTEAYWKTQKKLIKLTYIDPESGELIISIVDELYDLPKEFIESKKVFTGDHDTGTYCVTYVNEVWAGIKINTSSDKELRRDIYIGVGPNEFQFKGNTNIYGCKLPVCGQIFSARNSGSMSLVDLMKPYQIAYNVAMNQAFNLMEKEVGMFVVMDVNMFPNSKDWGGADSWEKWMLVAKNLGMLPADTSPTNIQNSLASTGGYLPKVIDMNLAAQMVSRMNLCKFFEEQALKQVGFNQYRVGSYSANTTATGVQQGQATSYAQTESYFTNFSNYLKRAQQMDLDIAQYVQSQKETIDVLYTKSDFSKSFMKMMGTDLLLSEIGVFVTNNQEQLRQLEMAREYVLNNNTAGLDPVSVMDVIMTNSPKDIRRQLDKGYSKMMEQQNAQQQAQQQAMEQEGQIAQATLEEDIRQFDATMENNLEVAYIKAGVEIMNNNEPQEAPIQDNSEELGIQRDLNNGNLSIKQQELALKETKLRNEDEVARLKLMVQQAKISNDLTIQNKETETARIMKSQKKDKK